MSEPFILTVREKPVGGGMRSEVAATVRPSGVATWLIYIHGHNVTELRAREQLTTLQGHVDGRTLTQARAGWVLFLWPSDLFAVNVLSKPTYPRLRERAEQAGNLLGDYLKDHAQADIVLVGHSLGALVASQAAREADRAIRGLALLSAAVKVNEYERPGSFRRRLARNEAVGHDPKDRVLRVVFPVGERLARSFADPSEAVGVHGGPTHRPWCREPFTGGCHDSYNDPLSGRVVSTALGLRPDPRPRPVPGRVPADPRAAPCSWVPPQTTPGAAGLVAAALRTTP